MKEWLPWNRLRQCKNAEPLYVGGAEVGYLYCIKSKAHGGEHEYTTIR